MTAERALPPRWEHQEREHREHRDDRARALLWSMRTGKTRACIDLALHLWREGRIDCVIVLAPNGVHDNWVLRELPKYSPGDLCRALAWSYPERDEPWFVDELGRVSDPVPLCHLDWLCVNSESLQYEETRRALGRFYHRDRKSRRRFLLICDESSDFGSAGSRRTQVARALGRRAAYVRILDGTVVEDSPLKAFSQFEILQSGALGCRTAGQFEGRYAEYETDYGRGGRKFPRLTGYRNLEDLKRQMARWSSVVLREDCHDMPEMMRLERAYRPSPEQLSAYENMRLSFSVSLDDAVTVTASEAAVRLIKLQQILSGYIIDGEGEVHDVPGRNPRLEAMASEVMFDPGKVIVWCRFQEDVRRCARRLREDGVGIVQYVGGMSRADKNQSVDRFQRDKGVKALVGTPVRGLELSEADSVLWYSHTFWTLMRSQADERATKMGGTATTVTDLLGETPFSGGVDRYVLDNQAGKRAVSEDLARGGLKRVLLEVRL